MTPLRSLTWSQLHTPDKIVPCLPLFTHHALQIHIMHAKVVDLKSWFRCWIENQFIAGAETHTTALIKSIDHWLNMLKCSWFFLCGRVYVLPGVWMFDIMGIVVYATSFNFYVLFPFFSIWKLESTVECFYGVGYM